MLGATRRFAGCKATRSNDAGRDGSTNRTHQNWVEEVLASLAAPLLQTPRHARHDARHESLQPPHPARVCHR